MYSYFIKKIIALASQNAVMLERGKSRCLRRNTKAVLIAHDMTSPIVAQPRWGAYFVPHDDPKSHRIK